MQAKHSKQELCILAAANAGLVSVLSGYDIGDKSLRWQLGLALGRVVDALKLWPGKSDKEETRWALNRCREWQKKLGKNGDNLSLSCLCSITMQSIIDIEERLDSYTNLKQYEYEEVQRKKELLAPIYDPMKYANDFFDEQGRGFEHMAKADKVLTDLYKIIGFEW